MIIWTKWVCEQFLTPIKNKKLQLFHYHGSTWPIQKWWPIWPMAHDPLTHFHLWPWLCYEYRGVFVQLLSTADEVAKLQEELEKMKPLLAEAIQESIVTMQRIAEDTVWSIDVTRLNAFTSSCFINATASQSFARGHHQARNVRRSCTVP